MTEITEDGSGVEWEFTYNADGMRTKRTNGTDTYTYVYSGSLLVQMTKGSDTLYFTYDASGFPVSVIHDNGTTTATYYYVTNLQGDVLHIFNNSNTTVGGYTYDAWGNPVSTGASTICQLNPLRYRGYVYDSETGLYYLQSRYYNPEIGRFINADGLVSTGQGSLGNNMFAYCLNNPTNFVDYNGKEPDALFAWWSGGMGWLCLVDTVLPIGDIIYGGGVLILGIVALLVVDDMVSVQSAWDVSDEVASNNSVSQTATVAASASVSIGRYAASKPVNLPSWKKLTVNIEHIKSGHMVGGSRNSSGRKGVFWGMSLNEILKAIQEAYNNSSKLHTHGERILIQGYSETYDLLIEMWLNIKDLIIETAYPK